MIALVVDQVVAPSVAVSVQTMSYSADMYNAKMKKKTRPINFKTAFIVISNLNDAKKKMKAIPVKMRNIPADNSGMIKIQSSDIYHKK